MKNIYVGLLAAVACTYSMQAAANSLNSSFNLIVEGNIPFSLQSSHTDSPLDIKPVSHPNNTVKLASVCSINGGGSCGELRFNSTGLGCEDEGYVTTCPPGQVKDTSKICSKDPAYFKCRDANSSCDAGYSSTQCSNEQVEVITYQNEAGNTCYQCRDKTCAEGGFSDAITSCQDGTPVSFANKTCYQNVADKTCESMGYQSSADASHTCTEVTECGLSCLKDCRPAECEDKTGYLTTCPENYQCETMTDFAGLTCYKTSRATQCSDGNYKSDTPSNQVCVPVTYAGLKCFDQCHEPTCEEGGHLTTQPDGQTCTSVTYFGKKCYKKDTCKPNSCTVPNCQECVDGSSDTCEKCKSGYILEDGKCVEYGTQCCYNPGYSLMDSYNKEADKFEQCAMPPISGIASQRIRLENGYELMDQETTHLNFITNCTSLNNDNIESGNSYQSYNFFVLSRYDIYYSTYDCSSMDLDYSSNSASLYITSPAYCTGEYRSQNPSKPSSSYFSWHKVDGELYEEPTEPNLVNIKVKSLSTLKPRTDSTHNTTDTNVTSFINVNLTATDKIVFNRFNYLSNSTLTAPEIHIYGSVTLANSKIIADNIYIHSGASIATNSETFAVNKTYKLIREAQTGVSNEEWGENPAYDLIRYGYSNANTASFIGSPERPAAFHIVKDSDVLEEDRWDPQYDYDFLYNPIVIQQENLTIYGYNAENIPVFSEVHIKPKDADHDISTSTYTLTIADMLGKGNSNLFRRFHTNKIDTSNSYYSDGKLIYARDFNNHNKTFYEEMKNKSYLATGISATSCELGSAQDMVIYEDKINYNNATCKTLGLRPASDPEVCKYYQYCENDLADDLTNLSEEYRRHWCQSCDTGEYSFSNISYNECLAQGNEEQECLKECSGYWKVDGNRHSYMGNFWQDESTGKYSIDTSNCIRETSGEEVDGKEVSGYVSERDKELYNNSSAQNQTLDCYDHKARYCLDPAYHEDGSCWYYISDTAVDEAGITYPICTILASGENLESACNRVRNTWNATMSNTDRMYISEIKPYKTQESLEGACAVCDPTMPNYKY